LFPRSSSLFGGIGQAIVENLSVPVGNRNGVRGLGETLPDVLNKLKALGGRQLKDFVSKGALTHSRKVRTGRPFGKRGHRSSLGAIDGVVLRIRAACQTRSPRIVHRKLM
jgi:hypothetical protein